MEQPWRALTAQLSQTRAQASRLATASWRALLAANVRCCVRLTHVIVLSSIFVLASCGAFPERPPGELFRGVERPPEGGARVYIFRPGFSRLSASDSPRLLIDGKEIVRLSVQSYTNVTVKPGTYVVSLRPNVLESEVWNGDWRLKAEAGQIYFLAVWNATESHSSFMLVPAPGVFFLPMPTTSMQNASLRFELIPRDEALPVISEQTYLPSAVSSFAPAH